MRNEFSTKTRKAALVRSGKICEAAGDWYGLPNGQRCTANLGDGVQYDHLILDANSKDNSLENCRAVCPKCHSWKTANRDTPLAAKTVRQQSMGLNLRVKQKLQSPAPVKKDRPAKLDFTQRRSLYSPHSLLWQPLNNGSDSHERD